MLRLNRSCPVAIDRRVIVSERPALDRLELPLSLPRAGDRLKPHGLEVEVLFGGILMKTVRKSDSRFLFVVALPRPLRLGERHEYAIAMTIPADQLMRSHYVYFPLTPCRKFVVRVRFDLAQPPAKIWRVDAAYPREVDDADPTGSVPIHIDAVGEVSASFEQLQVGQGYGIQWSDD